ncbi:sorting nexin 1 [Martiniozyma asiatica (nom. inval.)]|nr:sorting nexin 1 [Martiniozyma asiatica]
MDSFPDNVWDDGENSVMKSSTYSDPYGYNEDKEMDIQTEERPIEEEDEVDEFKIQNELAQTMQSIMISEPASSFDISNPFEDNANNYSILHETHETDEEEDKEEEKEQYLDDSYKTQMSSLETNILNQKKSELLNILADESDHPFLKDDENINVNSMLTSSSKQTSQFDNLMNLAGEDENTKSNSITSPNRKIQMLRPRRFNRVTSSSVSPIPLSAPLDPLSQPLLKNDSEQNFTLSPKSRKQKLINELNAPLFNVNKEEILKSAKIDHNSQYTEDGTGSLEIEEEEAEEEEDNLGKFEISVGSPITVGEFTNVHTVYTITTKTKSELFSEEETSVTRRYRDFLWLYNQLLNSQPGFIIPPPPEKQVVNRFDSKFIENRRIALEMMLQRIANRKQLKNDSDFILFLQSKNFSVESKDKETSTITYNPSESGDLKTMADLNSSLMTFTESGSSGGFFSSLIGLNTPKYIEDDDFIIKRQQYINSLDDELRQLSKALDMILEKREELIISLDEVVGVVDAMSDLEVNLEITKIMKNFGHLQVKIKDLLDKSSVTQISTFGTVIDQYIRIIGSIRNCFENRLKVCNSVIELEATLSKKQKNMAKLEGQKSSLKYEKAKEEVKNVQLVLEKQIKFKNSFNKNFNNELKRFEFEKVKDLRNMVEVYWQGLIDNQKALIELWETFWDNCNFE